MIAVIMPTRGRPASAKEAFESAHATSAEPVLVVPVLDAGDPQLSGYQLEGAVICSGNMIQRTNIAALQLLTRDDIEYVGWIADDNRFRTPHWDVAVRDAFEDPRACFVALNDLFWSEREKPVNVFVRKRLIQELGWYANPGQVHHFMDDTWRLLGISTDSYVYLQDVICEHLHPSVGKAEWDQQYREHETGETFVYEGKLFISWVQGRFAQDRQAVLRCLGS